MDPQTIIKNLAISWTLDQLCEANDIDPEFVIETLIDEGLIDLNDYIYLDSEELDD